ncbi:uncharacterized protein J4E84_004567 [Alternaria hordeiaustralica]|uniref:uncharacterized protein n=1 Tax=Alternaria hordeiaustralica TaxID=1187925 RepID=UPI0020C3006D|nr:uncharacterized protein J4E84_004567 [Alternaria hordeiaustralica]KAI4688637.1 hypothetical protein J4E84_004567 [Alternaria hordeiaustralica]
MSTEASHQSLQSLHEALARHGLPPIGFSQLLSSTSIDALDITNVPRFKAASYITTGVDRVSSRGTDNLISHAIPIDNCARTLEDVTNKRTLRKSEIRSKNYPRRWSVDCSAYSGGGDVPSTKSDGHHEARKYDSVFEDTDAFREAEAFSRDTYTDIQRLDVFDRDYTPSARPSHTVLETANASIVESQFRHFLTLGPDNGWYHDSHIDTSLDILERAANCQKHGIAICRVSQGAELYTSMRKAQELQNQEAVWFDRLLIEKCKDKDFILVPISNAYNDVYETGMERERQYEAAKTNPITESTPHESTAGNHWSLLLVDCRSSTIKGRYFDSSYHESAGLLHHYAIEDSNIYKAALMTLTGVRTMLNHVRPGRFNEEEFVFDIDTHCPNQGHENVSGEEDGLGACGPFVWEMSKEITQYIADCREDPKFRDVSQVDPCLPDGYQRRRNWDSAKSRRAIWNLVLRELRTREWLNRTSEWMDSMGKRNSTPGDGMAGWRSWLKRKGLNEMTFWDPWGLESELAPQFGRPVIVGS